MMRAISLTQSARPWSEQPCVASDESTELPNDQAKPLLREDLFVVLGTMGDRLKDLRDQALLLVPLHTDYDSLAVSG